MSITLDINGLEAVVGGFKSLAFFLEEGDEELMRLIGDVGRASTYQNFVEQGRPEPWENLSPDTLRKRYRLGSENEMILVDTGETMEAFSQDGNEVTVFAVEPHSVEWGVFREDFIFHDEGSDNEPERRVLIHQDEDLEAYADLYLDEMLGIIGFGGEVA